MAKTKSPAVETDMVAENIRDKASAGTEARWRILSSSESCEPLISAHDSDICSQNFGFSFMSFFGRHILERSKGSIAELSPWR